MSANVGQKLREARQAKSLTLEQVSRITHIRPVILEALEAGNLDALPSRTQARGFLRTYATHLGLDSENLIRQMQFDPAAKPVDQQEPVEEEDTIVVDLWSEIGDSLRNQRELLGITLDEAENQIRVRRHFLKALERGDLDSLPSPVQGRGMLNNYAQFLGLSPDPLLFKFAEGLQARLTSRRTDQTAQTNRKRRSFLRRLISSDLLLGGIILFSLMIFVIWAVGRISVAQDVQQPEVTAPSIVDVLDPLPTPTQTPTLVPTIDPDATIVPVQGPVGEEGSGPDPTEVLTNDSPVQVYIVVIERAWMRVSVDGNVEFEGRVIPGSAYPFSGRQEIKVLTGSGSALEVFYNQIDQGPMGLFGQIIERIYTADEILVPTPVESPTPTPTITPDVTETPSPTPES